MAEGTVTPSSWSTTTSSCARSSPNISAVTAIACRRCTMARAGLRAALDGGHDLVILDVMLPSSRWVRSAAPAAAALEPAGHHADRAGRRTRPRAGLRRRRRRLPGQAVRRGRTARAHPRGAAPHVGHASSGATGLVRDPQTRRPGTGSVLERCGAGPDPDRVRDSRRADSAAGASCHATS